MDTPLGVISGFGMGYAVGFIVATLRKWHELEEWEVGYWYTINIQDNRIDALEEEKQELRYRLAAEIWRNRRLNRAQRAPRYRGPLDDEAQWRVREIERQISAWEKL